MPDQYDIVIVGGGAVGCCIARGLLERKPSLKLSLLEKEEDLALHQSGRSSGVVHVGYNQKPGTLKARFVVEGNRRLRDYCRQNGVPLFEGGIVVVARGEEEIKTLEILEKRGLENGARVKILNRNELLQVEPHAAGIAALHAPDGASFDSAAYVRALGNELRGLGAELRCGCRVTGIHENGRAVAVETSQGVLQAGYVINAAGLFADRLLKTLKQGYDYQIIPFRGDYFSLESSRAEQVRSHIYACPDLKFPFLGLHLSRNTDGTVRLGPSAVLVWGREAYRPFEIHAGDALEMLRFRGFRKMLFNARFLETLKMEWKKSLFRSVVAREASRLLPGLRPNDLDVFPPGIRAQVVTAKGEMVDDILVHETRNSLHILNAVSPGLTCSLPYGDYVAERVLNTLRP